jgi:hypothetical protein
MLFHLIKSLVFALTGVIGFLSVQFYESLTHSESQIAQNTDAATQTKESPICQTRGVSLIRYDTPTWPGGEREFFAVRNDSNESIKFYVAINRSDPYSPSTAPMSFYYPLLSPVTVGEDNLLAHQTHYFHALPSNAEYYVVSVYGVRVSDEARFSINARYRGHETEPIECHWDSF